MPHLIIERLRQVPDFAGTLSYNSQRLSPSSKRSLRSKACALVVEVADLTGAVAFILGSLCFFPSLDVEYFKLGCEFFVFGSVVYTCVSMYALAESAEILGWFALETCENCLYMLVFLLGSLLAWPQNMDPETFDIILSESVNMNMHIHVYINTLDLVFQGSVLCITGCVCFAFAAFVNGLNIRHFNDVSSQMLSASTSLYMCGALLFVMGSMAFLPDFGCSEKMITLGAWLYTIGSCLYFLGSSISFLRTLSEIRSPVWELVHEDVNEKEMRYSTFSTSRF